MGGSSGCNGTICVRGVKQDYDDWGSPEWSGDEMFRCMRKVCLLEAALKCVQIHPADKTKAETFHPAKWFPGEEKAHGYDGPLHIEPAPCGPLGDLFLKNYQSKGLPYHPDMFSTGETANGCGHAMRTTWSGYRTTAADFITKDQKRDNVIIKCHSTIDKVIIEKDGDGELRAKGAEYVDDNGTRHKAFARKEVILSCGTYGSPAVLMRSGIGPKQHLEQFNVQF